MSGAFDLEDEPAAGLSQAEVDEFRRAEMAIARREALVEAVKEARAWRPRADKAERELRNALQWLENLKPQLQEEKLAGAVRLRWIDELIAELRNVDELKRILRDLVQVMRGEMNRG